MTAVTTYSYTHSVTYLADNILKSFKDILVLSGLDPAQLVGSWESNLLALRTWIESEHLRSVRLEIFDPWTSELITRWDIDIEYAWSSGEGYFWTDTDQLRYHVLKQGIPPNRARYRLLLSTSPGEPPVEGWGPAQGRSTEGMTRHCLGSTIDHKGLGGRAAYWSKK